MTPDGDYYADLPDETRQRLNRLAARYLGIPRVPDRATALRLLREVEMHAALADIQIGFLERAREDVLSRGRAWTQEELRRYCAESEAAE
jgi:hypothetical protein